MTSPWPSYNMGTTYGQATTDTAAQDFYFCGHCGMYHNGTCPKIKAIEYHPDGTVKRIEYHGMGTSVPVGTIR